MSHRLVIDGYNLFHRWAPTGPLVRDSTDPAAALTRALRRLAEATGRRKRRPLVVLDGVLDGVGTPGALAVRFAGAGRTADACIEEIVRDAPRPRDIVVVTSDRALGGRVAALGAQPETVETYLAGLADAGAPAERKPPPPSRAEVESWLEVFGDGEDILREEG
ncbi:MAG: NYN domain-containing protein [Planctomycetota bacterium]